MYRKKRPTYIELESCRHESFYTRRYQPHLFNTLCRNSTILEFMYVPMHVPSSTQLVVCMQSIIIILHVSYLLYLTRHFNTGTSTFLSPVSFSVPPANLYLFLFSSFLLNAIMKAEETIKRGQLQHIPHWMFASILTYHIRRWSTTHHYSSIGSNCVFSRAFAIGKRRT